MNKYSFQPLSEAPSSALPAFEGMTFPAYRRFLRGSLDDAGIVAVGAWRHLQPAGLGLARLIGKEAEILSVFVGREFRKEGIGTRLIASLEADILARGIASVRLTYNSASTCAGFLERILEKQHWPAPARSMLLAQAGQEIMKAPWFGARKFPPGFEMFPWNELTEFERIEMEKSQTASPWAPAVLWPFQYEDGLDHSSSLGLRRDGEVVGWVITNRIGEKTVRYTSAFVREEYRHLGRTFILISEAIRRQAEVLGCDSIGTFGVPMDRDEMVRLVRRKFAPWLKSLSETRSSRKPLFF